MGILSESVENAKHSIHHLTSDISFIFKLKNVVVPFPFLAVTEKQTTTFLKLLFLASSPFQQKESGTPVLVVLL